MVNNEAFSARLSEVIQYYELTASSFAERVGVQRSSISHLLSGRNKPSLDFVLKVLNEFPEVNLYWLMNGTGTFPDSGNQREKKTIQPKQPEILPQTEESKIASTDSSSEKIPTTDSQAGKEIERIVVFYKDGTFRNYNP